MEPETDITIDKARELVANQALWPRIRDFLWDFAPQIHASWLEELETADERRDGDGGTRAPLVSRLTSSPRVKRFILSSLGVEPCFCTFPNGDLSRLLLLEGATLESIVQWLGALACADSLRLLTDGKVVRALKAALPGVYPEVFGYTAYFTSFARPPEAGSRDAEKSDGDSRMLDVDRINSAGWDIISAALSHIPENLLRRLTLKLPKRFQASGDRQPTADTSAFGNRMISKLLKLKFPEAHSLCCS